MVGKGRKTSKKKKDTDEPGSGFDGFNAPLSVLREDFVQKCASLEPESTLPFLTLFDKAMEECKPLTKIILGAPVSIPATSAFLRTFESIFYIKITSISIWNAELDDEGCQLITRNLKYFPNLVKLEVHDSGFGDDSCRSLVDTLKLYFNKNVRTINLQHHKIGASGAWMLSQLLQCFPYLYTLDLSYGKLPPVAGVYLGQALASPLCSLQALDLKANDLGTAGLLGLANGLLTNTRLEKLNLADNRVAMDGTKGSVEAISTMLERNRTLSSLNLDGSYLSDDECVKLGNAISYAPQLKQLILSAEISKTAMELILNALAKNPGSGKKSSTAAGKKGKAKGKGKGKKGKKN